MKTLETSLKIAGFHLTQMFRKNNIAIYRQEKPGHRSVAYEVVKVRKHGKSAFHVEKSDGSTVKREIEEGEHYPSTGEWGTYGWTFTEWEDAVKKADSLLK